MKTTIVVIALIACSAANAMAGATYLGTANQDTTITSQTGALATTSTSTVITGSLPSGSNNIGDVDVLTLPALSAGTNNIGTVSGSSVTSILSDDGGEHATITSGRLDVNAIVTSANVSESTVGIRGSQGTIITSETQSAGTALLTTNSGRADLDGLSLVYKSSDSMTVGGSLTLTGKANQVDLQAFTNDCTFNIGGGESINVSKNNAESFNFDYTAVNLVVNLTAKSSGAICKVRITGAN